jgi:hypothetical protein
MECLENVRGLAQVRACSERLELAPPAESNREAVDRGPTPFLELLSAILLPFGCSWRR